MIQAALHCRVLAEHGEQNSLAAKPGYRILTAMFVSVWTK